MSSVLHGFYTGSVREDFFLLILSILEASKLEHGFRRISATTPYTLHKRHEDNHVPTFWRPLQKKGHRA